MDIKTGIELLSRQAVQIQALLADVGDQQARWKPDPESWSLLEVVTHLHDEEIEDFRSRLDVMLHQPDQPWSSIDPAGWVISRGYNQRKLSESLASYREERRKSIAWLRSLGAPDLTIQAPTPWGTMPIGDMFAAWIAHDLLHMRQLVEVKWAFLEKEFGEFNPEYAGRWRQTNDEGN